MKRFAEIYMGFIGIPLILCMLLYILYAFTTWSLPTLNIDWFFVRTYLIIGLILSFIFSVDE